MRPVVFRLVMRGAFNPDRGAEMPVSAHVDVLLGVKMPLAVVIVVAAAGTVMVVVVSDPDNAVPCARILFHNHDPRRTAHACFANMASSGDERHEDADHFDSHRCLLAGEIPAGV